MCVTGTCTAQNFGGNCTSNAQCIVLGAIQTYCSPVNNTCVYLGGVGDPCIQYSTSNPPIGGPYCQATLQCVTGVCQKYITTTTTPCDKYGDFTGSSSGIADCDFSQGRVCGANSKRCTTLGAGTASLGQSCWIGDECVAGMACNATAPNIGFCNYENQTACTLATASTRCKNYAVGGMCNCQSTTAGVCLTNPAYALTATCQALMAPLMTCITTNCRLYTPGYPTLGFGQTYGQILPWLSGNCGNAQCSASFISYACCLTGSYGGTYYPGFSPVLCGINPTPKPTPKPSRVNGVSKTVISITMLIMVILGHIF